MYYFSVEHNKPAYDEKMPILAEFKTIITMKDIGNTLMKPRIMMISFF